MSQGKIKKLRKQQKLKKHLQLNKVVDADIRLIGIRQILKENWKFLLILCVGTFLLYFNSLWGDFVSDDYAAITQDPNVADIFGKLFLNIRGSPSVANAIIASIFGVESPIPFHALSLVLFLIFLVLFFLFTNVIMGGFVASASSILFAVLPVHVEAVSWISGKPYLLNGIAVMFSLLLFSLYDATRENKYLYYFLLSLLIVFYAEPIRSAAIVLCLPFFVLSLTKNIDKKMFFKWYFIAVFLLGFMAFLFLRGAIVDRITTVNTSSGTSESIYYNPFFQYPTAISKYLQMLLFPVDLTLYHTMYVLPVWLNWLILLIYLSLVVYTFFRNKRIFFSLIFIFAATASSMAPVKVSWLTAERYIFLGSAGFCIFLVLIAESLWRKTPVPVYILFINLTLVYGIKTFFRNIDWQTNHNLWVATVQVSPNSHNAWNNIGDDYDKLGQYENAVKSFTQSTVVKPNYADAFHNRANIFFKVGRLDLARESYETALSFNPRLMQTYISLVQIDLNEGKKDLALEHAKKAVEIKSNNIQAQYVLGIVYKAIGENEEAKKIFESILSVFPDFNSAKEALIGL